MKITTIIGMVALLVVTLPAQALLVSKLHAPTINKLTGITVTDAHINFQVAVRPANGGLCVGSLISDDMVLTSEKCALPNFVAGSKYRGDTFVYHKDKAYIVKDVYRYIKLQKIPVVILHLKNKITLDTTVNTVNIMPLPNIEQYDTIITNKNIRYTLFAFLGTISKVSNIEFAYTDVFMPLKDKSGKLYPEVKLKARIRKGNSSEHMKSYFSLHHLFHVTQKLYKYPSTDNDTGGVLAYKINGESKFIGLLIHPGNYVNLSYGLLMNWYNKILKNPASRSEYALEKIKMPTIDRHGEPVFRKQRLREPKL